MKNIVLIGMPGSGKSTVGVVLAKKIGYDFADTDIIISKRAGKPLPEIVEKYGFNDFIALEGDVGFGLNCKSTVIATGGSMVLSKKAMDKFKNDSIIVWLDTDIETITKRLPLKLSERGIAAPKGSSIVDVYKIRLPYYKQYADIHITCNGNADDIALEISSIIF